MILPYLATILLIFVTIYSAIVSFRHEPDRRAPSWIFPNNTKRATRMFAGAVTLAALIVLVTWLNVNGHSTNRRSLQFLIPAGYSGWVRVEFEVPGAPPLPSEAGQTVLKIPPSGMLKTSSREPYGWAKDHYDFYTETGLRSIPDSGPQRLIWGKINGEESSPSGKHKFEEFFVGTWQQYNDPAHRMRPQDTTKDPNPTDDNQ